MNQNRDETFVQHILINNQGFIGEKCVEESHSINLSQATNLDNHSFQPNTTPLFFRPSYEELTTRFQELKNNNFTIILTPEQDKEQQLLSTYFPITLLHHVDLVETVKEHLQIELDDKEFREQAQQLLGLRSLYCILKLDFLNYSYLHNNFNAKQTITVYTKEDFKQLPAEYTYAHKYLQREEINPIFYELLYSEMIGLRDETISVYEKILDDNQEFTSPEKGVIEELKAKYWLIPLEEDGKTKLTFGYPIRD